MSAFEFLQAINLQLLPGARGTHNPYLRQARAPVSKPIPADDWPRAFIDLSFVAMRRRLDLAPLIAEFCRGQDSPELIDLPEFVQDSFLESAFENLHSGRAGERIHHKLKKPGFLQHDGLSVSCEANVLLARRGKRFVRAVAMTGVGRIHVSEQQLDGGARQVVLVFVS